MRFEHLRLIGTNLHHPCSVGRSPFVLAPQAAQHQLCLIKVAWAHDFRLNPHFLQVKKCGALAEVEIGRSRNWPNSKKKKAGRSRNWPKSIALKLNSLSSVDSASNRVPEPCLNIPGCEGLHSEDLVWIFLPSRFFLVFFVCFSCCCFFPVFFFFLKFVHFCFCPCFRARGGIHKNKHASKQASREAGRPAGTQCTKHLKHLAPTPWSPKLE